MATLNQKAINRIVDGLKKFQPLVSNAKTRDINESDTVVLLTGILSDVLGYDKYTEITTEKAVKNSYCDLAIKINDKIEMFIEAKAVGIELKEQHITQAVSYATFGGVDWAVLTNGINWRVYKVIWGKPVTQQLVFEFNFLDLKTKNKDDVEKIGMLCRESLTKASLEEFYNQRQATSRFMIGNLLFEDTVVNTIKKELKQVYPDIKCTNEEIAKIIHDEVVKREIIEGDEATDAQKKIARANKRVEKLKAEKAKTTDPPPVEEKHTEVQTQPES